MPLRSGLGELGAVGGVAGSHLDSAGGHHGHWSSVSCPLSVASWLRQRSHLARRCRVRAEVTGLEP